MKKFIKKLLLTVATTAIAVTGFGFSASAQVVTPDTGNIVLKSDEDFVFTFDYKDILLGEEEAPITITRLEVDHSLQGVLPEFHLAADNNPYEEGDEVKFTAAGVEVAFSGTKWTITFKQGGQALGKILDNGGITFYLALIDSTGKKVWGQMDPVIPENTFAYSITREVEPKIITTPANIGAKSNVRGETTLTFTSEGISDVAEVLELDIYYQSDRVESGKWNYDNAIQFNVPAVQNLNVDTTPVSSSDPSGPKISSIGIKEVSFANNTWTIRIDFQNDFWKKGEYDFLTAIKFEDKQIGHNNFNNYSDDVNFFTLNVEKRTSSSRGSSGSRPVSQTPAPTPAAPIDSDTGLPTTPSTPEEKVAEIQKFGDALLPGARGESVAELQKFLNENGFGPLAVDGISGPQTLAAVERYINSSNNSASGITPSTILKVNNRGAGVSTLQALLNAKGFNVGPADGIFGPRTLAQVRAFQSANGLVVDGIVGPATLRALGL